MSVNRSRAAIVVMVLLLPLPAAAMQLSVAVDGVDPSASLIPPGEHLLTVEIRNDEDHEILSTPLRAVVTRLHQGEIWNASGSSPPIQPGASWSWSIPLPALSSGLHTLGVSAGAQGSTFDTESALRVSSIRDPWQEWRSPSQVPNKTHRLLAFYYPWYGTPQGPAGQWIHWAPEREYDSTHVPLIGFYDSRSEEAIRYHIRVAQSAGVDAFIASWWGPGNYIDDAIPRILDCAAEVGFNVSVYLEVAADRNDLKQQLRYLLTRYGSHPAYMKSDGRPVIFIYSRVMGTLALADFSGTFDELAAEGLEGFYIADRLDPGYLGVFDGIHSYSPLTGMDRYPELARKVEEAGGLFAATIAPGYDDTIIRDPGLVVPRADGAYYEESWEMIMLSQPDWVLITSWNEWHEGSEIEPSLEFGDAYLNLTSEFYLLFEEGRLTPRWTERIAEIEELFDDALAVIKSAEAEGLDVRLMRRDYGIAEDVWRSYDYDTARMYLLRVTEKGAEVDDPALSLGVIFLILTAEAWARRGAGPRSASRCA